MNQPRPVLFYGRMERDLDVPEWTLACRWPGMQFEIPLSHSFESDADLRRKFYAHCQRDPEFSDHWQAAVDDQFAHMIDRD